MRARSTLYVCLVSVDRCFRRSSIQGSVHSGADSQSSHASSTLIDHGLGLSDPLVVGGAPPLEQQVADIAAVMDAVGSDRAAFYTGADGGPVAILFAAMYPERVSGLVLNSTFARMFRTDDYPIGFDPRHREVRERSARPLG